jgi:transcriptional regulator with XRE-family HTH domain
MSPSEAQTTTALEDEEREALAQKLHGIRMESGMAMRELARRASVSASLISQIEAGRTSPSISTLRRLAQALDVPIASFFLDNPEQDDASHTNPLSESVVRAHERKHLYLPGSSARYELLTPNLSGEIEFVWAEFEPGHPVVDQMSHEGEEVILVLEGTLEVWMGEECVVLSQGDSLRFDCSVAHRVFNPGPGRNIHVSAITPPAF